MRWTTKLLIAGFVAAIAFAAWLIWVNRQLAVRARQVPAFAAPTAATARAEDRRLGYSPAPRRRLRAQPSPAQAVDEEPAQPEPEAAVEQPYAETESAAEQTDTVHVTSSGTKFHKAGCRYLSKSDTPMSRSDALAQGYTPCSVCNP